MLLWSRATVRTGIAGDASSSSGAPVSEPPVPPASSRSALRHILFRRRAAFSGAARVAAVQRIAQQLARQPWLRPGAAIALYVSRGPEVDTGPLRRLASRRGCRVFLPRITDYRAHRMLLVADRGAALRRNRYRIDEPAGAAGIAPQALAVVLLPLVGFDAAGNRIGNGAGYYDRYLAARRGRAGGPLLIGIAFECQRCATIDAAPHDVPLDAVVTENGTQYFRHR